MASPFSSVGLPGGELTRASTGGHPPGRRLESRAAHQQHERSPSSERGRSIISSLRIDTSCRRLLPADAALFRIVVTLSQTVRERSGVQPCVLRPKPRPRKATATAIPKWRGRGLARLDCGREDPYQPDSGEWIGDVRRLQVLNAHVYVRRCAEKDRTKALWGGRIGRSSRAWTVYNRWSTLISLPLPKGPRSVTRTTTLLLFLTLVNLTLVPNGNEQ